MASAFRRSPQISGSPDSGRHEDLAAPGSRHLLYIAGYGRSGSTLFGRLLAQNPDVLNLGEVVFTARLIGSPTAVCGCGKTMAECPVWACVPAVRQSAMADRRTHRAMLEAVLARAPHRIVVDVSKTARSTAFRPVYLDGRLSVPVTAVHLVRDPRAVLWSVLRERLRSRQEIGLPQQVLLALRIAAAWNLGNLAADLSGRLRRGRTIRVDYEEALLSGVPAPLRPLLGEGPLEGAELKPLTDNNHSVAGNAMPQAAVVRLDREWRTALRPGVAMVVVLACLPLLLRYGLLRRPRTARLKDPASVS